MYPSLKEVARDCELSALEARLLGHSKMRTVTTILGHLKLLARLAFARLQARDSRR